MIDLSYLLYTSLQIPILNTSLLGLLRVYHEAFENYLITDLKFNRPIQFGGQELNLEGLLEEWAEFKYYGLTMALIYLPCMCAKPENIPDMEALDMKDLSDSEDSKFSNFMNVEYTLPRLTNFANFHLPV